MEIQLYQRWDSETPKSENPPFEDAYSKEAWETETLHLQEVQLMTATAILDEQGKPRVKWVKSTEWHSQYTTRKQWAEKGRNHVYHKQTWTREVLVTTWWMQFDTLEQFIAFIDQHELTYEDHTIIW